MPSGHHLSVCNRLSWSCAQHEHLRYKAQKAHLAMRSLQNFRWAAVLYGGTKSFKGFSGLDSKCRPDDHGVVVRKPFPVFLHGTGTESS